MRGERFDAKDFRFLANIQRNPNPLELRIDLGVTWEELREQYEQAKKLDASWLRHLRNTTHSDAHERENVLLVISFLRTALTTKESLLRLTQRFVLLDGIHLTLCQVGKFPRQDREKWEGQKTEEKIDLDSVIVETDKTIRTIEKIIDEIEFEISEAKKSLQRGECRSQNDVDTPLKNPNSDRKPEEEVAKELERMEIEVEPRETYDMEIVPQEEPHRFPEQQPEKREEVSNAQELSDEDYLIQLIRESSGENEEQKVSDSKRQWASSVIMHYTELERKDKRRYRGYQTRAA
ncbi:hypothetical protein GCK32_021650 [Trichostrongylus colubriformis]|uniref:Uncharacterized protein n=1 Tax=Trichostrongylus colubriformis TaxID=6319 RepID=A0AAN8FTD4_TRICO